MKSKYLYPILFLLVGFIAFSYFQFKNESEISKWDKIRGIHEQYLANSPFKQTLQLSKKERKSRGIPPNKYYEREWELTMNPATGKPEPEKVFAVQDKREITARRAPGDGDVTNDWVDRGPNNVAGRTRVLLFDPNDVDFNRVFAGGVSGGLWVNEDITDENLSWSLVEGVPGNMNISSITVDPNNSQNWYISTGEQYTSGAPVGNGVYKSTNGGVNWSHLTVQLAGGGTVGNNIAGLFYINEIIAWNNGGSTELFMGVGSNNYTESSSPNNNLGTQNAGLYRSINNGLNWSRIESLELQLTPTGSNFLIPNDFEISADNTLWFGSIITPNTSNGGGKVFSSTDGANWNLKAEFLNSNRVELAVSSTNKNKIYALIESTNNTGPHIFVTTDGFITNPVQELGKPNAADNDIPANDFTNGQAFYDLVVEVDPSDDNVVYVGGIDMYRTTAGDNTIDTDWKQISKWSNNDGMATLTCSLIHADQHTLVFRPGNSNEAIIGNDGGVYYASSLSTSETNEVINSRNNNYNITQFYSGSYGQDISNELLLGGTQDNGSQFMEGAVEGSNSSFRVFGGDGGYSAIDKDGNYMITSYTYNNYYYYKLPYTGNTEYDITASSGDFINPAGLDDNLNILYTNAGGNVVNRFILGNSDSIDETLSVSLSGSPTAFKASPYTTTSTTLLVGTANSKLLKITNADEISATETIVLEDISKVGDNLDIANGSDIEFSGSVSDIEFGATENDIYVTFHNYGVISVWYSNDGGVSWKNIEGDLPDIPVKCILPNPSNLNEVIIGTELGVWSTANANAISPNWVSSYNGMRDVKVVDLDLRSADNSILAATHGRGLFTGKFTDKNFTFSTDNTTVTYCGSGDAVFNINFNTYPNFDTKTNFSTTGEPVGSTIVFNPTSLNNSGSFSMTVSTIGALAIGEYPITVIGTAGAETNQIDVVLKIVNPSSLSAVTAISPANEATDIAVSNVDFTWNENTEATSYEIEIATDTGFNSIVESESVLTNSYTSSSIFQSGIVYYWRVSAVNDCFTSDFSEVKSFQTAHNCDIYVNSNEIKIPDGKGAEVAGDVALSIINISESFSVSDVNVTVNISHSYINDLVISILSPDNTEIVLFERECTGENDIDVIYDDQGLATINCVQPITGISIPKNLLSAFNGKNSVGDWTLKVVDYYNGDWGVINSWAIEICENKTVTNSTLVNNLITTSTNSSYTILNTDIEASSVGSLESEQVFMLNSLPEKGEVKLNGTALTLGTTFTQEDINLGNVSYVNSSSIATSDSFKVDVTNATGGFLPSQEIQITIDLSLQIDDFFSKSGILIYPTISNGGFSISTSKDIAKSTVEIYSVNGQKVYSSVVNFSNRKTVQINASGLSSGVYILKITTENNTGSKKIVIK